MRFATLITVIFWGFAGPSFGDGHGDTGRIVVSGEGVVSAAPDMATVQLGVSHEGNTAAEAMQKTSDAMAVILAGLAESGVAERDVQTTSLNLSPRYTRPQNNQPPRVNGYIATNMVMVRVRDLDGLGGVLDGLVSGGANAINGISFGMNDAAALESEARKAAVSEARSKAEELAEAAGVSLGDVLRIDEGGVSQPQPMMRGMAMAESAVPIAGGEVSIRAFVTITYAIDD